MTINDHELKTILKTRFGFDEFRDGQLEAICTLLSQNRLICIQPTGHGKSLLYQLPATLLNGITLVISPLLALVRDQILHLTKRFNIPAAAINSDQTEFENNNVKISVKNGKIKILFIAPEQLDDIDRFDFILALPISLIVIDEAHCISTWGHDFRPSYRQIIKLVQNFETRNSSLKVLGLTATANAKTESDIKQQLSLGKPISVIRSTMDRPNIFLSVIDANGLAHKLNLIENLLQTFAGDGLIYCSTRENAELVAEYCQNLQINAAAYHAGLDPEIKRSLQQDFIAGKYKIIAATNALGMGIDKQDLRFIIHFDIPGSITAYYQEVGRCGRDGLPANGVLLFDPKDKKIQQYFINSAQPSEDNFHTILNTIKNAEVPPGLLTLKRLSGLHPTLVTVIVAELLEQNLIKKVKQNNLQVYITTKKTSAPDLSRYSNQFQTKNHELNAILNYSEQKNICRMQTLRLTLGDEAADACTHCDICTDQPLIIKSDALKITETEKWLNERTVSITGMQKSAVAEGISILDGKLRSPLFIHFMQQRANSNIENFGLSDELLTIIKKHLNLLAQQHKFGCVISIPSRTWKSRASIAMLIAQELKIPVLLDTLIWNELPNKRQGELLNNDQRRFNVENKMLVANSRDIPSGTILLLDDYIGSGATIKEAARALHLNSRIKSAIVPFTIATVKWKLGQPGMI